MFTTSATAIRIIQKAITRLEKFYSPEKYASDKRSVRRSMHQRKGEVSEDQEGEREARDLEGIFVVAPQIDTNSCVSTINMWRFLMHMICKHMSSNAEPNDSYLSKTV